MKCLIVLFIPDCHMHNCTVHHEPYPIHSLFSLLQPMLLHASTFLTVMMARERYLAISNPTEYRNATLLQGWGHAHMTSAYSSTFYTWWFIRSGSLVGLTWIWEVPLSYFSSGPHAQENYRGHQKECFPGLAQYVTAVA